ncbi:hypothetical protein TrLO_g3246 [Triparma laevis f. longispina]|uniref:UBC core domain-containing protein n=1 Tax=Triparma laevis f. longispina TaxID=1714387 RepID=A0A9W7E5E8_9STRA|nr:hypothetical protein TrLO_g3246 [Triparma laevis f. longispina]
MSDNSSDDDFEYNYSDSDCDDTDNPTTTTTTSAQPSIYPSLDALAHTKKCFRSSPSSQRPWVNFCTGLGNLKKNDQRELFFSRFNPLSAGGDSEPNRNLAQSYLMIDYDTPNLHSITLTLLDGRDTIRASVTLSVNWPDLPLSVENIGLNASSAFDEEKKESTRMNVMKKGKIIKIERSTLPEQLLSTWNGKVTKILQPKRKSVKSGSVFQMVYWVEDAVVVVETEMGVMNVGMVGGDGTVEVAVKVGDQVNINTPLGKITPINPPDPSLGSGPAAAKRLQEQSAAAAKKQKDIDKIRCTEKLIYPVVPPSVTWNGPRLSFKNMSRIIYLPELQPSLWNLCTDLNSTLKRMFEISLSSPVLSEILTFTPAEEELLNLQKLSRICERSDSDGNLVSFGVSKDFALSDGKGDGVSKKRGLGEDGPRTTGFAKGTGYSGGNKVEDRNIEMGDSKKADYSLLKLYAEFRDDIEWDTLEESVVEQYCEQKLREAGDSFMELDQNADEYLVIFLWGGELWRRIKGDFEGKNPGKKVTKELTRGVHKIICMWQERFEQLEDGQTNSATTRSVDPKNNAATIADLPAQFLPGLKIKNTSSPKKKPAKPAAAKATGTKAKADDDGRIFNIDDVISAANVIFNEIKDDVGDILSGEETEEATAMDVDDDDPQAKYKAELLPLQCAVVESFTQHVFLNEKVGTPNSKCQKRILTEFKSLSSTLPLEHHGAIFCRWSETQTHLLKVLIIAPDGTPYGGGCFVFDVMIPGDYPNSPPKMKIVTTGGGRHRFNPNLYADGKVCLSLLGTWQGEPWDPKVSSLNQVFMSIYALIFVEEPWFNEPGYQGQRGTPQGDLKNKSYNAEQRYKTVEIAMYDQLRTPDPTYSDIISRHFRLRKEGLLEQIKTWAAEMEEMNNIRGGHSGTAPSAAGLTNLLTKMKGLLK